MSDKILVAAGVYYLGDPAYLFDYDAWNKHDHEAEGVVRIGECDVITFKTAMGDGIYGCRLGRVLVDSGSIGLVPESGAMKKPTHSHRVVFKTVVTAYKDGNYLVFGPYMIDTNPHNLKPYAYVPDDDGDSTGLIPA